MDLWHPKADSLDNGANSAEGLYSQLLKKYPGNPLTKEAGFNLAMEYINRAQDKINLYLGGKDELKVLDTTEENKKNNGGLNKTQMAAGKSYSRNAHFLNRAATLLKQDTGVDIEYITQLQAKANFLLARSYVSNEGVINDFPKALQLANDALRVQPGAAYNYHLLGLLYSTNKQYDSSIYFERKALDLAPKWANIINGIGMALQDEKKYDSAEIFFRKAIALDPDFLIPYTNLSYNFLDQNMYDSAKLYGLKSIVPDVNYFKDEKVHDSAKLFPDKAVILDSLNAFINNNLGINSYFLKQNDPEPQSSEAYFNLAQKFAGKKMYDSSIFYYKKLIKLDPENSNAFYNLCCAYSLKNDLSNAIKNLEISFQKGFDDYDRLQEDTDLDNIRNSNGFKQLLKKYFPGK